MIPENEAGNKERTAFRIITFAMLIFSPIVYLVVAYVVTHPSGEPIAIRGDGQTELAFNILLIVSVFFPSVYPLLEKFQISIYKKIVKRQTRNIDNRKDQNDTAAQSMVGNDMLSQIFRTKHGKPFQVASLYKSVSVIKYSLIGVTYMLGLAIVFITMDLSYLIYFYPIGIIWTIIYWPKESKYVEFKRKLESV